MNPIFSNDMTMNNFSNIYVHSENIFIFYIKFNSRGTAIDLCVPFNCFKIYIVQLFWSEE